MLRIGRHEHHVLASLVASRDKEGIPVSDEEASALIGYAPATISMLRQQKPFQRLVLHYAGVTEPPTVPNPLERMAALGLSTLEELQARLHDDPDSFTKRELLEMAELLLVKAAALSPRNIAARDSGVRVAIQFVEAQHKEIEPPQALNHVNRVIDLNEPNDPTHVTDTVAAQPGGAQEGSRNGAA